MNDQALSACLKRLADHGLTLNASKCKLLTDSLSFFGQVFTAEGTKPDVGKTPARMYSILVVYVLGESVLYVESLYF